MDVIAPIARHLLHPALALKNASRHLAYLREYQASQYWPPERLREHQLAALLRLLHYAFDNSPFYRRRFTQAGLRPQDIRRLEDLEALPPLTKTDLQQHRAEMVTAGREPYVEKRTSGSTGTPLAVLVDQQAMQRKRAATLRHNSWAGLRIDDPVGLIWGDLPTPTTWRGRLYRALAERSVVLDSQRMASAAMLEFCRELRRRRIRCIIGQAQPLCEFAAFVLDRGEDELPIRSVIPTAMALHRHQRTMLERDLGWQVFERYGSEETSIIASECECHHGMHVHAEGVLLEVARDEARGPQPPPGSGERGPLLVTDLLNFAMPLIRYDIGDIVAATADACPCGRGLPLLAEVSGRVADCILSPDGHLVSGIAITDHLVGIPGIRQVQIVQTAPAALRIVIVPGPDYGEATVRQLQALAARIFGPSMRIECRPVTRIMPDRSGKYRFAISTLARDRGAAAEVQR